MRGRDRALLGADLLLLAGACLLAAGISSPAQWEPLSLVGLLLLLAVGSDMLALQVKSMRISGSFLSIVLAFVLLGPAPAVAIGIACTLAEQVRARAPFPHLATNLATYATFPLVAGVVVHALSGDVTVASADFALALYVFAGFVFALLLNFTLIAVHISLSDGVPLREQFRTALVPLLPSELATALLAVGIAYIYLHVGVPALILLALVLFTFQYLLGALLVSEERAEELERRTTELASLQVGVLTAMLQTLNLRDHMTARHSAAVARYSRELALAAGFSEEEQDLVHTAGLLHDIGKFIFPDSILLADRKLDDSDWEIVKRHPTQGAKVVRQVDGYGPVADIILCHHERMDGRGYPRAIPGDQIPRLARIISIADTYDTMVARKTYRQPVSPAEAIAELKRVSGTQLDGELVTVFIDLLARKGIAFQHADDADFEAELGFEGRVRSHAAPRPTALAS